jgi:hypothetical protein
VVVRLSRPPASMSLRRLRHAQTLFDLFALAFAQAVQGLAGGALAELVAARGLPIARLGWVDPERIRSLREFLAQVLVLDDTGRAKLVKEQREEILVRLGDAESPKAAFVLAVLIDAELGPRFEESGAALHPSGKIAVVPKAFFDGVENLAPPLGQMTPTTICMSWMRYLRPIPTVKELRGIGSMPRPRGKRLTARPRQRLQDAIELEGELRVACTGWRQHKAGDCVFDAEDGLFALTGVDRASDAPGLLADLLKEVRGARAHVLLLPELALSTEELQVLQQELRSSSRALPVLTVAGLHHRRGQVAYVNEAVVLDSSGRELLRHQKLEPYSNGKLGMENIVPRESDEYHFLDTPVGRLVVNICRDVASDVPMLLNRALGVSLLLVPAYSNELAFVGNEARTLGARQRCITVGTNAWAEELRDAAIGYAPLSTPKGPSRSEVLHLGTKYRPTYSNVLVDRAGWGATRFCADAGLLIFRFVRTAEGTGHFDPPEFSFGAVAGS